MSFTSVALAVSSAVPAAGDTYVPPSPNDFWHPLFGTDGAWAFTRPMLLAAIAAVLLLVWLIPATRKASAVPTKGQYFVELFYNFVRNGIGRDMIGSKEVKPFMPLLFSLMMFILLNNLFGVIPPFQNPPTARIGFAIALVLVVYLTYHYAGIRKHGVGGYLKAMVPGGVPAVVAPLIFLIEALSKFVIQPATLALRLFGNMLAGHMVLVLFILGGQYLLFNGEGFLKVAGVAAYGGAIIMTIFEILIQCLQAYVFTLLSASYIGAALAEEH
ncbi:MAG: F0F1 ATP synthase subunit A [Dermatophilus congolensis]|nr:F0F1 ATP synthase subunit A [Dermatophilus congolensis]